MCNPCSIRNVSTIYSKLLFLVYANQLNLLFRPVGEIRVKRDSGFVTFSLWDTCGSERVSSQIGNPPLHIYFCITDGSVKF